MRVLMVLLASLLAAPALPQTTGSATLAWDAATLNSDGTAIVAPVTYKVYRGLSADALALLTVTAKLSYTDIGLSPQTWFYGIKTQDGKARASSFSNIVAKTIAGPTPTVAPQTVQVSIK